MQDIRLLHKTSESNFSMEDLCPAFIKAAMTCTQSWIGNATASTTKLTKPSTSTLRRTRTKSAQLAPSPASPPATSALATAACRPSRSAAAARRAIAPSRPPTARCSPPPSPTPSCAAASAWIAERTAPDGAVICELDIDDDAGRAEQVRGVEQVHGPSCSQGKTAKAAAAAAAAAASQPSPKALSGVGRARRALVSSIRGLLS